MISIIVPIYNDEKYIERCIESIRNQTIKDIEIIAVDDGSTDRSAQIIDDISKYDNRIHVIHKENGGQTSARLLGVENARYDCVGFVDADDYIEPNMFEEMYDAYKNTNADLVSSGIFRDYANGDTKLVLDRYDEGLYKKLKNEIYPTMLFDFKADDFGLYCNLVNKLFKRDIVIKILKELPKNIIYGEDAATLYKYCLECKRIYILKKAYYHYCIRNDSICASKDEKLYINDYALYKWLYSAFECSEQKDVLIQQLKQYMLMIQRHRISMMYDMHPSLLNYWEFNINDTVLAKPFIIYGAGGCGQAFFKHIKKLGMQENIVSWVDKEYKAERERCNFPLESIETALERKYEYIIIAIKDRCVKETVRSILKNDYNIVDEKIILLDCKEYVAF